MRVFLASIFVVFFALGNAFAINFGDSLKEIGKGSTKGVSKSLDKKIDKVVEKFEKKVDGKIAKYEKKIEDAEKSLDKLKSLKARAEGYIKMAKIVIVALSSGILVLIFIMWRIWKTVTGLRKVIKNVTNYDDIEKRLKVVEKKVGA